MTIKERDKYGYELMVKNNPDEVVKQLLLKDKIIKKLNKKIFKVLEVLDEKFNTEEPVLVEYEIETLIDIIEAEGKENENNESN